MKINITLSESKEFKCLNCGEIEITDIISYDELGTYISCSKCNLSFDVNINIFQIQIVEEK